MIILEPAQPVNSRSPTEPQIRIASAAGNENLKTISGIDVSGHVLWGGAVGFDARPASDYLQSNRVTLYNETLWSAEYHTYELIWSINKLVLKVDGQRYFEEDLYDVPRGIPVSFKIFFQNKFRFNPLTSQSGFFVVETLILDFSDHIPSKIAKICNPVFLRTLYKMRVLRSLKNAILMV